MKCDSPRAAGADASRQSDLGRPRRGIWRALSAEALGTALLLAAVIGSGIMGARLSPESPAVVLLVNSVATGAALVVIITVLGPVSGAHLNPAVTLVFAWRGAISGRTAACYIAAQLTGAVLGVWATHLMFAEPWLQISLTSRDGFPQAFSEVIATFGLILTILGAQRFRPEQTAALVGLYITSAYWFTASTSFANPAVTIAREFSDTFAGIAPGSVSRFIAAQIIGALLATVFCGWLFEEARTT